MDAKVHPARPVHRNAVEMIGLGRRDRHHQKAVGSVGLDVDLDVAVHHPRHSFLELCPERVHGCHPSASAGAGVE
jgi:hypothetical protein